MKIATVLTIFVIAAAGSTAGSATAPPKPRLVVATTTPLVLKGSGFKTRESVRLVVTSGDVTARRLLRATMTGRFTATFVNFGVDRCNGGMTARAIGLRGSSAVAKLGAMPQCPPAP